jgi:ABC-2 type transport system permease protein
VSGLAPAATLAQREIVRFFREKSRIAGALGSPIVFWLLIGSGFGPDYRRYLFPGTAVLILLFAAIFSTISVIEDRREGFLQSVLVSPAPRLSIVAGKIGGGAALALLQALVFLFLAPVAGIRLTAASAALCVLVLALLSISLTALGFAIAWKMESTQGFHAIMNLFLIPLWLLSGAFFPDQSTPAWLKGLMTANPLSYGVRALREAMVPPPAARPTFGRDLAISAAFGAVLVLVSAALARRRSSADLS